MSKRKKSKRRICILDEIRGTAVAAMLLFHFLFTAGEVFNIEWAKVLFKYIEPIEPAIAVTFIFVSGICTQLSRSNLKRGGMLLFIALAINVVTEIFIPELTIRFGVINLLSVCILLYSVLEKAFKKIKAYIGMIFSFFVFMLTWGVDHRYLGIFGISPIIELPQNLYSTKFLFPLGFKYDGFTSGDYFPLFPWLFLFIAGVFFSQHMQGKKLPVSFYKTRSKVLSNTGKYSLVIYIVHQPVIFAFLYVAEMLKEYIEGISF